ncbi:GAF domain-containing protein [Pseudalkalibacillus caeni]|uniref:histidine kinase n=2 Tax=Exobacillus caeni TaxID=2574798 RepID=A0A5R9F0B8_9BACL|nr:GAF domain-containing protein [Pseudalkalibacillus caeni]
MLLITLAGWTSVIGNVSLLEVKADPLILSLMVLFLGIAEYYPMPVWKGFTSISFPLVYTIYLVFGVPVTLVVYSLVVVIVNLLNRRPLRIILFNPAQLALSFFLAVNFTDLAVKLASLDDGTMVSLFTHMGVTLLAFYVINNFLVDMILTLRPQPYPLKSWKQKSMVELRSVIISFVYLSLLIILGSQNRGIVDVFSFFFFFSPLIGLSLLTSIIVRLQKEKNRLKALFSITTELNRMVLSNEWIENLRDHFTEIIDFESGILWTCENGSWERILEDGGFISAEKLSEKEMEQFATIKKPLVISNRKKEKGVADRCFKESLRALIYAPLVIEEKTVGMLVVGRSRTKSFTEEDIQSIVTLANQLAVVLKTKSLLVEQEKRLLLEERNRIARDIHDGVAQSLAGAVMKLETARRKYEMHPDLAMELVNDSMEKLRGSLREVRESIYALRPYPTEKIGLKQSLIKTIKTVQAEHDLNIVFEERGEPIPLSSMVQKVMFDTFKESIQNIIKHSGASNVHILISYQTEHVLLRVKDDGIGFSLFDAMLKARNEPHFGILTMNEEAEKVEATLQIDSKPGEGTEVTLTVPKLEEGGEIHHDQSVVSG